MIIPALRHQAVKYLPLPITQKLDLSEKKSILHKTSGTEIGINHGRVEQGKQVNGEIYKKHSVSESVHSKIKYSESEEERSWWYSFCLKCRSKKEEVPSWQPDFWPKLCPQPFCLTYRQFTRIISLNLIGLLSWCILYAIVGDIAAPPDGKLFQLILLTISAHIGGWLISLTTLPTLIGMLFTGVLLQNIGVVNIDESFSEICKQLRNVALVIILIRAGLDLDPKAIRKLKFTVMKLGIIPWSLETLLITTLSVFSLGLPWSYGILLGSIVSAVSPAVVVPCLFRLRIKGYGVAKGIPSLIIAVSGIDDAFSVAFFGIIKGIVFSDSSLANLIIQGPVSIIGGIGFGVLWGIICNYSPERNDPFLIPLRIILLLVGGLVAVFGSDVLGYGGAGPLGCVIAAFTSLVCWSRQGWDIEDNPAATAFEIFWMIFEPILFGITGASVKLNQLEGNVVLISVGMLIASTILRIICTILVGIGCELNLKEKIFVAIAWMAKATVQAALGPVALGMVAIGTIEYEYADKILATCVLSIMLTAPTGAILITLLGPRLLTKTKFPIEPEGWRRSHRPSVRDISIIDEEEERGHHNVETENNFHINETT
nr:sodium/hydrogen exchanger 9B2-like [Leptinotarsa decemlineata]